MPAFLISYDLRKVRDYAALIKQLRDWQCISPLESLWLGNLVGPAATVRDILRGLLDNDDGLLVVELPAGADWATYRVNENAASWLQTHVAP